MQEQGGILEREDELDVLPFHSRRIAYENVRV
jgi:hypothetical protein